jgi:uncharacterized protein (DUF1499 family)
MKAALLTLSLLAIALVALFFILGVMSKSGKAPGLVDGRLAQCPDKPNCVCSEAEHDAVHSIQPIMIPDNSTLDAMPALKQVIRDMGGTIQAERDHYLAATFSSTIFGFVDDLEVRVDAPRSVIHVRSASRVGHSDMGVNRQRAEMLRKLYLGKSSEAGLPTATTQPD